MERHEITEILSRPLSRELLNRDLTRLAYVALDGTPRVVPIAFTWNGTEIVLCTTRNAPKLPALRAHRAADVVGVGGPDVGAPPEPVLQREDEVEGDQRQSARGAADPRQRELPIARRRRVAITPTLVARASPAAPRR